jgi:hypothetical protein
MCGSRMNTRTFVPLYARTSYSYAQTLHPNSRILQQEEPSHDKTITHTAVWMELNCFTFKLNRPQLRTALQCLLAEWPRSLNGPSQHFV